MRNLWFCHVQSNYYHRYSFQTDKLYPINRFHAKHKIPADNSSTITVLLSHSTLRIKGDHSHPRPHKGFAIFIICDNSYTFISEFYIVTLFIVCRHDQFPPV